MVNNIDNIKELLNFKVNGDTYYFIQVFKRRKDNPNMKLHVERLRAYCVYSLEELDKVMESASKLADKENARVYIRLNSQSALDVSLRCIKEISENIINNNLHKNMKVWNSVSGKKGANDYWVLDVDFEHINEDMLVKQNLKNMLNYYFKNVRKTNNKIYINNTKSGYHIITSPFDTRILRDFNARFTDNGIKGIDIQKDANTLIYSK